MNYQRHYNFLIERARGRVLDGYSEIHHIVPKCLGGDDSAYNKVALTAEEHFVAHQLLVKIHPDERKLVYAACRMTGGTARHMGRASNKLYGWLRRKFAALVAERHKGKVTSRETRLLMSEAAKDRWKSADYRAKFSETRARKSPEIYRKAGPKIAAALTGKTHTLETRSKVSAGLRGRPMSPETRAKISAANKGSRRTADQREKMSKARLGKSLPEATKQKMSVAVKNRHRLKPRCPARDECGRFS